jgi:hypothetical protein
MKVLKLLSVKYEGNCDYEDCGKISGFVLDNPSGF